MKLEIELWKEIEGYPGKYYVSNLGRVKGVKYYKNHVYGRVFTERIFSPFKSTNYLKINFTMNLMRIQRPPCFLSE